MKKLSAAALVFIVFLTACSVQDTMNSRIFIDRLCKQTGFAAQSEEIVFEGLTGSCLLKNESGTALMLRTAATDESLQMISCVRLTVSYDGECPGTQRAAFIAACTAAIEIFAAEDKAQAKSVISALSLPQADFSQDEFKYHNTLWYRYTFVTTKIGAEFSVESRRIVPDSSVEMSLSGLH